MIGSSYDNDSGEDIGSVYVFERSGGAWFGYDKPSSSLMMELRMTGLGLRFQYLVKLSFLVRPTTMPKVRTAVQRM